MGRFFNTFSKPFLALGGLALVMALITANTSVFSDSQVVGGSPKWKAPVANVAALPANDTDGSVRVTLNSHQIYVYNGTGWGESGMTAESDPIYSASNAAQVNATRLSHWDTAYGWGNHANAGYVVANANRVSEWDTAYGWGNHAAAGYASYNFGGNSFNGTGNIYTTGNAAVGSNGAMYIGVPGASGWAMTLDGNGNFAIQHFESGAYVTKTTVTQ